jgi:hypothetical protein
MSVTQNKAILPQMPFSRTAVAVSAETSFHNPTNMVDLLLGTDNLNGARITKLYAIPRAAVGTANNCQLYKRSDSTYILINSALGSVHTPSASVANAKADFGYSIDNPLELEAGEGLAVAIGQGITNGVAFFCNGGLY